MTREEREARRRRAQTEARRAGNRRALENERAREAETPPSGSVLSAEARQPQSPATDRPRVVPPNVRMKSISSEGDTVAARKPATPARTSAARSGPAKKAAGRAAPAKRSPVAPPSSTPASGEAVSVHDAVQHMALEHIQCRDFGHSWRPYHARLDTRLNEYEVQLRCDRCTTIRTRWLDRRGAQVSSTYDYVEGYQVKGLGRLTGTDRDEIRLASLMAILPADTAAKGA